ncbi:hypothetical protein EVAR_49546_1 [Eumeta japonica]|uniref:Uncharacterized protein n=1 Tax=Eumeta variegata TaxID=151549 RepID=A0A4C1XK01_EUMVA|nr:hypothetical protein EVAR_49546_1 [Eumeta japonica]
MGRPCSTTPRSTLDQKNNVSEGPIRHKRQMKSHDKMELISKMSLAITVRGMDFAQFVLAAAAAGGCARRDSDLKTLRTLGQLFCELY